MTTKLKSFRLNIPIDIETNEQLESMADKIGVTKAGMVRIMINKYINDQAALDVFTNKELMATLLNEMNKPSK